MAVETLICGRGADYSHEWTREKKRGVKPNFCPDHADKKPAPSNGMAKARAAKAAKAATRAREIEQERITQLKTLRANEDGLYAAYRTASDAAYNTRSKDLDKIKKLEDKVDQRMNAAMQTTAAIRALEKEFPNV